jgi:signal transduction histidine kinase
VQSVKSDNEWQEGFLRIDVIDNGLGISPEEQVNLFRPFN